MTHAATPILVGVGQFAERIDAPDYKALSPVELAAEAARAAFADASARTELAPHVDAIATTRTFEDSAPHLATPFGKSNNFPRSVAKRLSIDPSLAIWEVAGGNTPQHLVGEMFERIARGELRMALVAGGEAVSTVRNLVARGDQVDWSETLDEPVEDRGPGRKGMTSSYLRSHGLLDAPPCYAICEHARRRGRARSRSEYAREMGELFAPFSRVASENPLSSSSRAYTPDELIAPGGRNRMIADPYPRLLVARDQVNQGAALLLTSVELARELGIPEEQWIYLHGYADLRERELLERQDLGASPAARLAAEAALTAAGIGVSDVGHFDLYSCFPIAVFAVCDALGLAADDPRGLTTTGGLPYFGGPGNNYSMHGIASLAQRLRDDPGAYGFLGANGGYLSKYSVGIYSTRAAEWRPCDSAPLQARIDALPAPALRYEAEGPAEIETYTVVFDRDGAPSRGIVLGRLEESGERFLASTEKGDAETARALCDEDPLGRRIQVRAFGFGNRFAFGEERLAELYPPRSPRLRDAYEFCRVERRGRVLEVTIDRPEVRNCLHPPANEELEEIFDAFEADAELWVAIITGAGSDAFCSGNDLKYTASGKPVYVPRSGFAGLTSRSHRSKPVIAAVAGYAMGGGFEICLAADLVVADETAKFALSEVRVGLTAGAGGLVRLPRQIPKKLATEMILTGRRVGAAEGRELGFVNRVVPAGEALAGARALADEILEGSPTSVRLSLQVMREADAFASETLAARHRYAEANDELLTSEDMREGVQAFLEKREPQWKNR